MCLTYFKSGGGGLSAPFELSDWHEKVGGGMIPGNVFLKNSISSTLLWGYV